VQQLDEGMSYVPEFKLAADSAHSSSCAGSECFIFSDTSSSLLLDALLNFPKIHQKRFTVKYLTVIWGINKQSAHSVECHQLSGTSPALSALLSNKVVTLSGLVCQHCINSLQPSEIRKGSNYALKKSLLN